MKFFCGYWKRRREKKEGLEQEEALIVRPYNRGFVLGYESQLPFTAGAADVICHLVVYCRTCKRVNQAFLLHPAYGTITMLSNRDPATGGGGFHGKYSLFFSLLCGWCSLPLHHQMVRWRQVGQH